jgi:hypothetical protein
MMIVPLAEPALTNVRLKQYQKAISIKLILTYVPIVVRVLMFARLKQFTLHSFATKELNRDMPLYVPVFYFI